MKDYSDMISELVHLLEKTDDNSYTYRKRYHIVYKYNKQYLQEFYDSLQKFENSIENE